MKKSWVSFSVIVMALGTLEQSYAGPAVKALLEAGNAAKAAEAAAKAAEAEKALKAAEAAKAAEAGKAGEAGKAAAAAKAGDAIHVSKEAIVAKVAEVKPATHMFVKDAPVMGYKIDKGARMETLPKSIREALGKVDATKYTPEYFKANEGSVIALQLKDGKEPDFYIIGKSTLDTKYRTGIPLADVSAKNKKYLNGVRPHVGNLVSDPHYVGILKTVPTPMHKLSELGFPVERELTLESPWGLQTKPAGHDAYVVYDESKSMYYMVNADAAGLPLSYVPQSVDRLQTALSKAPGAAFQRTQVGGAAAAGAEKAGGAAAAGALKN